MIQRYIFFGFFRLKRNIHKNKYVMYKYYVAVRGDICILTICTASTSAVHVGVVLRCCGVHVTACCCDRGC